MHLHNKTPGLDRARGNLTNRTLKGALDGSLTGNELGVTRQALGTLNDSVAAAKSDGQVTRGERKSLHAQKRKVSKLIHKLRHNQLGSQVPQGPGGAGQVAQGPAGPAGHSHGYPGHSHGYPGHSHGHPGHSHGYPGHSHGYPGSQMPSPPACGHGPVPSPCGHNPAPPCGTMWPGGSPGFDFSNGMLGAGLNNGLFSNGLGNSFGVAQTNPVPAINVANAFNVQNMTVRL
jgi:hypothetical protein